MNISFTGLKGLNESREKFIELARTYGDGFLTPAKQAFDSVDKVADKDDIFIKISEGKKAEAVEFQYINYDGDVVGSSVFEGSYDSKTGSKLSDSQQIQKLTGAIYGASQQCLDYLESEKQKLEAERIIDLFY